MWLLTVDENARKTMLDTKISNRTEYLQESQRIRRS